jgi:lactobin A/cerein 7B family class IIb bacteriocin
LHTTRKELKNNNLKDVIMENLNSIGLSELTDEELKDTEGGIIALIFSGIGLCIASYAAGYMTGNAIF